MPQPRRVMSQSREIYYSQAYLSVPRELLNYPELPVFLGWDNQPSGELLQNRAGLRAGGTRPGPRRRPALEAPGRRAAARRGLEAAPAAATRRSGAIRRPPERSDPPRSRSGPRRENFPGLGSFRCGALRLASEECPAGNLASGHADPPRDAGFSSQKRGCSREYRRVGGDAVALRGPPALSVRFRRLRGSRRREKPRKREQLSAKLPKGPRSARESGLGLLRKRHLVRRCLLRLLRSLTSYLESRLCSLGIRKPRSSALSPVFSEGSSSPPFPF